jgi:hypothetical protein
MQGLSIRGIIIAVVVTLIAGGVAGVGLTLALGGWPLDSEEAMDALTMSTPFLVGSLILGILSTVLGGFVAARIAKTRHYANAAVIGVLGVIFGVFLAGWDPLWVDAIGLLLTIPAALLGGHLAIPAKQGNA